MTNDDSPAQNRAVQDRAIHIDDVDARGASTPGIARYVLAISLLLAIIAMTAFWVIPALW